MKLVIRNKWNVRYGALRCKILLVRIIKNDKIDAYFIAAKVK